MNNKWSMRYLRAKNKRKTIHYIHWLKKNQLGSSSTIIRRFPASWIKILQQYFFCLLFDCCLLTVFCYCQIGVCNRGISICYNSDHTIPGTIIMWSPSICSSNCVGKTHFLWQCIPNISIYSFEAIFWGSIIFNISNSGWTVCRKYLEMEIFKRSTPWYHPNIKFRFQNQMIFHFLTIHHWFWIFIIVYIKSLHFFRAVARFFLMIGLRTRLEIERLRYFPFLSLFDETFGWTEMSYLSDDG